MNEKITNVESNEEFEISDLPYSKELVERVVEIDKNCFSAEMQFDDALEYFDEALQNPEDIKLFLSLNGIPYGYILGKPHNSECDELMQHDTEITRSDVPRIYIDSMAILPEARNIGNAEKLILALCRNATTRGIRNFSTHSRTINKLNDLFKKLFEDKLTEVRSIPSWHYANGEPYEYLEWSV